MRIASAARQRFRQWLQPSLTGRVVKALMGAFLLAVVVLVAVDYVSWRRSFSQMQPLQDAVQAVALTLPADEAGAVLTVQATERQYNYLRSRLMPAHEAALNDLLFELSRPDENRVVHASAALAGRALPPQSEPVVMVNLAGQRYSIVQARAGPWRLRLLQPLPSDMTALQWVTNELLGSVAIAFPFVLLPVWWAVRRGLAPLRLLSAQVAGRASTDFTPLNLDLRLSELQPLVASFNQLLGRSQAALSRERALVQDAAHEMRTPLAVIGTQAHALVNAAPGAAQQQALQRLEAAIARASHQVHQVLTLARMEGRLERAPQDVECVELVRQAIIDAAPRARELGIELALDAPERLPARLDLVAFHSVLDNLLVNALLHATGATRIQVDLAERDGRLVLRVADDGPGIADEDRARLFERFHRGRHATAPGSGLGLSIVQQACALLGGDVSAGPGLDGRGVAFEARLARVQVTQR